MSFCWNLFNLWNCYIKYLFRHWLKRRSYFNHSQRSSK